MQMRALTQALYLKINRKAAAAEHDAQTLSIWTKQAEINKLQTNKPRPLNPFVYIQHCNNIFSYHLLYILNKRVLTQINK